MAYNNTDHFPSIPYILNGKTYIHRKVGISYVCKEINPEEGVFGWEFDSKPVLEGTAVECHNTLRMPDGK